ncbi:MAG: V-type ATP synthase subunit D [Spirochaetota bacterium]
MQRIEIAPTRSNLRKVRSDLEFAYEGFDLLNQKREILVLEIMKTIKGIKETESELETALDEHYMKYKNACVVSGAEILAMKSVSEKISYTLTRKNLRLMGISIPEYSVETGDPAVNSSLAGTGAAYDMIKVNSAPLIKLIINYSSLAKKIFLLSSELKKVQRKVNALEKIFIPSYEDTKKYISDRLEEMEREEISIKKLIGRRIE